MGLKIFEPVEIPEGYQVTFSDGSGAIHWTVLYQGMRINSGCLLTNWHAHTRAARKALKQIQDHQKAIKMLERGR